MSDKSRHLEWASRNRDFSTKLVAEEFDSYQDWRVVVLFYTALHYVDAYLAEVWGKEAIADHKERNGLVDRFLREVKNSYYDLKNYSEEARYEFGEFTEEEADELEEERLEPLIEHIKSNLDSN